MSRFLLAVWSLESHVNPNLALAAALRDAGHQVAFYAGAKATPEIEQNGFQVFPFERLNEKIASAQFAALLEDQKNARKLSQHFSDLLVSQLDPQVEDLNAILDTWHPDVLVTDMAMVAPFAILHDLGRVRVAVLSHVGYCMLPGAQGPVPGRAMPPRLSRGSKLRAWAIQSAANFITREVPRAIDAARLRYGLKPTRRRVTEWHSRAGLLLIPSVQELDYNRTDLPTVVRYVGAISWPPSVQSVPEPRVIAVEEGGYYRAEPFLLRAAIAAFRNSNYVVKLSPGRDRGIALLGLLPANISFQQDAPEASLVITTGNTESILRALSRGIPVIVVPSLLDQTEMAWRVKLFGAGEYLREEECSAELLLQTATALLNQEVYKRCAASARALIDSRGGPREAVRLLEQLAHA